MPRESLALGKLETLLAARLRRALQDGAFHSADMAELERVRKEFEQPAGAGNSSATQHAGDLVKRSRAQTLLDEIKQLGHMPRETRGVESTEMLLAARLRRALKAGAFQSADTAELEMMRKDSDQRQVRKLLDDIKQLGYKPTEWDALDEAEKSLAIQLKTALRDYRFQPDDRAELQGLLHELPPHRTHTPK